MTIRPRHVRLRMVLEGWDERFNHGAFLLGQEAAGRGIELTASILRESLTLLTKRR